MSETIHLLDVNVMIALTEREHSNHRRAAQWFGTPGLQFALCAFSEARFLRMAINPRVGGHTLDEAGAVLETFERHPGYRFWPVNSGWADLAAAVRDRILGHQQITDAYLLGLAIKRNGVLVSMDKGIKYLAGQKFSRNLLLLE